MTYSRCRVCWSPVSTDRKRPLCFHCSRERTARWIAAVVITQRHIQSLETRTEPVTPGKCSDTWVSGVTAGETAPISRTPTRIVDPGHGRPGAGP